MKYIIIGLLVAALFYLLLKPTKETIVVSPTMSSAAPSDGDSSLVNYKPKETNHDFSKDLTSLDAMACAQDKCMTLPGCSKADVSGYLDIFTNEGKIKDRITAFHNYAKCMTQCAYKCLSNEVNHQTIHNLFGLADALSKVVFENIEVCSEYDNFNNMTSSCIENLNTSLHKHLSKDIIGYEITLGDLLEKLTCLMKSQRLHVENCSDSDAKEMNVSRKCFNSLKDGLESCLKIDI